MSIESMKQWREALKDFGNHRHDCPQWPTYTEPEKYPACDCGYDKAITSIDQAIADLEKQEPAAWRRPFEGDVSDLCQWLYADEYEPKDDSPNWQALYDHPQPKRKPLTNERIETILNDPKSYYDTMTDFARAIEAAHGIKGEA